MGFMDEIKKAGREIKRACKDITTAPFVRERCAPAPICTLTAGTSATAAT